MFIQFLLKYKINNKTVKLFNLKNKNLIYSQFIAIIKVKNLYKKI